MAVLRDIGTVVTTVLAEHSERLAFGVFVDGVVIGVAEEQRLPIANPGRSLGELEAFGYLEQLRIGRHDRLDGGIVALHRDVDLVRRDSCRSFAARKELQLRFMYVDVVG